MRTHNAFHTAHNAFHAAHYGLRTAQYAVLLLAALLPAPVLAQAKLVPIVIETSMGSIEVDLDSARAPITVTNFLKYVDAHTFDGGNFYRVVRMDNQPNDSIKIQVIQGGISREKRAERRPAIPLERTSVTGLKHVDGTISMARSGPDTGTTEFSIMVGDQPELDFGGKRNPDGQGFAAFGRVTKGFDVIKKIQSQAANGQNLVERIAIVRIVRR
ncbi:MAG TPA: peptidylprolyl isomerase [Gemmatimonadaceae bacterium]|nr:peptidylprolyl isomerase [Gemmatimonadaceae bacterium]